MIYGFMLILFIAMLYFRYEQNKINADLYNNQRILAESMEVEVEYDVV